MAPGSDIGPTFGALYLGCIVSTALYGFTSNQAFVYFMKYFNKDTMRTRLLVRAIANLVVYEIFTCRTCYLSKVFALW